jgi:hypothetical protein
MPVANNLVTSALLAPLVTVLAAVSLATVQRGIEWVTSIAKNPQRGALKQIRPMMKHLDTIIERILGGSKFTVSTTNILLMTIAILLFCMILEANEKPKTMRLVEKKKSASKDSKDE